MKCGILTDLKMKQREGSSPLSFIFIRNPFLLTFSHRRLFTSYTQISWRWEELLPHWSLVIQLPLSLPTFVQLHNFGFAKYLPTLLSLSSALNHLHQSKPNNVCEQFQTFSQECNTSGVGLWKWWKVSHQRWDADAGCRWERQCADWTVSLHLFIVMNSAQFYCVFRMENAHGLLSKVM